MTHPLPYLLTALLLPACWSSTSSSIDDVGAPICTPGSTEGCFCVETRGPVAGGLGVMIRVVPCVLLMLLLGGCNLPSRDPGNGDFRLSPGSPAIDSADGQEAPFLDLDGNPRRDDPATPNTGEGPPWADMGAYEFQP